MLKVSSELKDVHIVSPTEFELANLEIRVGRERDEALRNLAERLESMTLQLGGNADPDGQVWHINRKHCVSFRFTKTRDASALKGAKGRR
jgi:hypothetical protein